MDMPNSLEEIYILSAEMSRHVCKTTDAVEELELMHQFRVEGLVQRVSTRNPVLFEDPEVEDMLCV
jgi:hypothetical protein